MWVVRVGGDDGEHQTWQYIYVYSIESRLMMRVGYENPNGGCGGTDWPHGRARRDWLQTVSPATDSFS